MATIVNTPGSTSDSGNSMGLIVAVLLIAFFGILFFVYGLPMLRRSAPATEVVIPDQINVDVNTPQTEPAQ